MSTTTQHARTILNDSGVLCEAAHYFCCCQGECGAPMRRWIRLESLMFAVEQAVETYGATPEASFADDYRRTLYWAKRARKANGDVRTGKISAEKHARIIGYRDMVASAFGQRILDALAFSGREFSCHLHPQAGTWAFKRDVLAQAG